MYIRFATRPVVGRVYFEGKITQVIGQPTYSGIDAETAPKLLEGLVRWIIATESGAKFTAGSISLNGRILLSPEARGLASDEGIHVRAEFQASLLAGLTRPTSRNMTPIKPCLRRSVLVGIVAMSSVVLKGLSGPAFETQFPRFTGAYHPDPAVAERQAKDRSRYESSYEAFWRDANRS